MNLSIMIWNILQNFLFYQYDHWAKILIKFMIVIYDFIIFNEPFFVLVYLVKVFVLTLWFITRILPFKQMCVSVHASIKHMITVYINWPLINSWEYLGTFFYLKFA